MVFSWLVVSLLWFGSCESRIDQLLNPYSSPILAMEKINKDQLIKIIGNETMMNNGRLEYLYEGSEEVCYVPNIVDVSHGIEVEKEDGEQQKQKDVIEAVNIINSVFNDQCFDVTPSSKQASYWSEKLCSNDSRILIQSSESEVNILGQTSNHQNVEEYKIVKDKYGSYISQLLTDGTICDLTGSPRVAEVHYMCDRSAKVPEPYNLMEVKTCSYVVTIMLSGLCSVPSLTDEEALWHERTMSCFYGDEISSSEPLIDLVRDYSFMFLQNNNYFLLPQNITRNRPKVLYHTNLFPLEDIELSLEEEFLNGFSSSLPHIFQMELLKVSQDLAAKVGDQFLYRVPVIDYQGTTIMLVDLSMNFSSQTVVQINHNLTLLQDLPTNNFIYYNSLDGKLLDEDDSLNRKDGFESSTEQLQPDFETDDDDDDDDDLGKEPFLDLEEDSSEFIEPLLVELSDELDEQLVWAAEIQN